MLVCICIIHMIHVKYRKITFTMMKLQKNFLESDYSKVPEPPGGQSNLKYILYFVPSFLYGFTYIDNIVIV